MIETIFGIVAGLIVTVVISRYYYHLSAKHRLSLYVLQTFEVISDVDPDVAKDFSIEFCNKPVRNLTVLELLIVNEGTHPVRDCVEPLAVKFPDDVTLLDVKIPYVHPEGRRVLAEVTSGRGFEYNFSILNPREYFLTKIIADGYIDLSRSMITIGADNLPPTLKPQIGWRVETAKHTNTALAINLGGAALSAFVTLFAVSILSLIPHLNRSTLPPWLRLPLPYPVPMVAVIAALLLVAYTGLFVWFVLAMLFGGTFPPPRRFLIPEAIRGDDHLIRAGAGVLFERNPERTERWRMGL